MFVKYDVIKHDEIKNINSLKIIKKDVEKELVKFKDKSKEDINSFVTYVQAIKKIQKANTLVGINSISKGLTDYTYLASYEMLRRPVSIGCQPSNFAYVEHDLGNHGVGLLRTGVI